MSFVINFYSVYDFELLKQLWLNGRCMEWTVLDNYFSNISKDSSCEHLKCLSYEAAI